jgi:hypothetical protein
MLLPAVIAFTKVNHLGVISLLLILISVVFFSVALNALTLLILVLMSSCYYTIAHMVTWVRFSLRGLLVGIVLAIATILFFVWRSVRAVDLVALFKADQVDVDVTIANISRHFHMLPTHPFAYEITMLQAGKMNEAFTYFLITAILAVVFVVAWTRLSYLFYPSWQKFQEGNYSIAKKTGATIFSGVTYHFTGGRTMALFKKELLISSRNLKGVMWFLFLFAIWLAQIGTNIILSHNIQKYQPDITQKLAILQALQFIIAMYFICSFTLRFAFPSFSTEKKTAWILAGAPLNFKKIFLGKYLFYTSFFVLVGLLMSSVNARVLHLTLTPALHSVTLFISVVIFIVTLGLFLGVVFPSLDTDDPEVISTSMSGLFFTALSLMYGALSAWILYLSIIKGTTLILLLFILLTFILIGVMLYMAPKLTKSRGW